jgi:predicted amidohydrolase YtcJ
LQAVSAAGFNSAEISIEYLRANTRYRQPLWEGDKHIKWFWACLEAFSHAERQQLLRELTSAGAPVALGSDAPQFFNVPGFSIHPEMEMMVAAGLTPYEVLVTGTRNPAVYFGTPEEFGTVQVGRRADLILLEANPLEDIGNVRRRAGVMVRGRWLPESEIQQRLDAIAEEVRRATE